MVYDENKLCLLLKPLFPELEISITIIWTFVVS